MINKSTPESNRAPVQSASPHRVLHVRRRVLDYGRRRRLYSLRRRHRRLERQVAVQTAQLRGARRLLEAIAESRAQMHSAVVES